MLLASGSIRTDGLGPVVLFGDLEETFPFDDAAYMINVTGDILKRMLLYMLRDEIFTGVHCEFYQFSRGLRAEYDRATHSFTSLTLDGEPVEDARRYTVGLQGYHFLNFEEIFRVPMKEIKALGAPRMIATSCKQVLEEYLSARRRLDARTGERIIIK